MQVRGTRGGIHFVPDEWSTGIYVSSICDLVRDWLLLRLLYIYIPTAGGHKESLDLAVYSDNTAIVRE